MNKYLFFQVTVIEIFLKNEVRIGEISENAMRWN